MKHSAIALSKFVGRPVQKIARNLTKRITDRRRKRHALHAFQEYDKSLPAAVPKESPRSGAEMESDSLTAIYFSCQRDYSLLRLSLMSLQRSTSTCLRKVYIYEDASNPFESSQRRWLLSAAPVEIVTGPRVTGWGADTLLGELGLFRRIAELASTARTRWVVKIDSDVLFLGNRIFEELAHADCDLFGQPFHHPAGITYPQGGCYFLRTSFLGRLVNAPVEQAMLELSALLSRPVFHLPEDASIFQLAKNQGARVAFRDYYLPHERVATFIPSVTDAESVIHFESGLGTHLREHMHRIGDYLVNAPSAQANVQGEPSSLGRAKLSA